MYKDKVVNKNVKDIFLSMCDVKVSLTFTSLSLCIQYISVQMALCYTNYRRLRSYVF